MEAFSLKGKRALITGGSRGIGYAIARCMAEAGANLTLVARTAETLDSARVDIKKDFEGEVDILVFDLAHWRNIQNWYESSAKAIGNHDIVVNCAGINPRAEALAVTDDQWQLAQDILVNAPFALSRAFAKECRTRQTEGVAINIGSLMAHAGRPTTCPYTSAKHGLSGLTKSLAIELAPTVRVTGIDPGYIKTDMNAALVADKGFNEAVLKQTPMNRWGTPEDIGWAAVFLASKAGSFMCGQHILVDGGFRAPLFQPPALGEVT